MADDVILVTESGQTNLQAYAGTVSGKTVKAEAIVLVDTSNSPVGTATNPIRNKVQLVDSTNANILSVDASGRARAILYATDFSGGIHAVAADTTGAGTQDLRVAVVNSTNQPNLQININGIGATLSGAQSGAPITTSDVVQLVSAQIRVIVNTGANAALIGLNTWIGQAGPTGYTLAAGSAALVFGLPLTLYCISKINGLSTTLEFF